MCICFCFCAVVVAYCSYSCSCSCSCSSICLPVYLSAYLQVWKRSYSARLPQFLNLTTSEAQHFCSRLLQFLNLTTSKTKQVRETSSIFQVDNIKTKQFCETSFKNGKLSAELTASYQDVVRFFHCMCLKCCACHEKVMPGSAAPVTQNHLSKPEDLMLQNATCY